MFPFSSTSFIVSTRTFHKTFRRILYPLLASSTSVPSGSSRSCFTCISAFHITIPKPITRTHLLVRYLSGCRTMSSPTVSEYGAWRSPISSEIAAGSDIQFNGLEKDACCSSPSGKTFIKVALDRIVIIGFIDIVYWIEQRPSEAGRNVICKFGFSGFETSPEDRRFSIAVIRNMRCR